MSPEPFTSNRFERRPGIRAWRTVLFGAAALATLAGCRQKMGEQPYYRPLQESEFFTGKPLPGSSARPLVEGTVSRGALRDDEVLFTGKQPGELAPGQTRQAVSEFPFSITEEVIKRGQVRYNIYCSPCHGFTGDGQGMIVHRGLQGPANFHDDRMTTAPVGHYFDVVTNGFGRMYSMDQIPVRDRWAIIAYIRALQLSQKATLEDVESDAERQKLLAMPVTTTLPTTGTAAAASEAAASAQPTIGGVQ